MDDLTNCPDLSRLDDRVAIVTGAGSRGAGIGNGQAAAIVLMARFSMPHMRKLGPAAIVKISSVAGRMPLHPLAFDARPRRDT